MLARMWLAVADKPRHDGYPSQDASYRHYPQQGAHVKTQTGCSPLLGQHSALISVCSCQISPSGFVLQRIGARKTVRETPLPSIIWGWCPHVLCTPYLVAIVPLYVCILEVSDAFRALRKYCYTFSDLQGPLVGITGSDMTGIWAQGCRYVIRIAG